MRIEITPSSGRGPASGRRRAAFKAAAPRVTEAVFFSLRSCRGLQTARRLYRFKSRRGNDMRKIWGQTLFSSEPIFFGSAVTCGRSEASAHLLPPPPPIPSHPGKAARSVVRWPPSPDTCRLGEEGAALGAPVTGVWGPGLGDPRRSTPPSLASRMNMLGAEAARSAAGGDQRRPEAEPGLTDRQSRIALHNAFF